MKNALCLIGKHLPHTLSPEIHAAFGSENYGVVELEDELALSRFVAEGGYAGFNVTIPYKQGVIPMLDELDDVAREVGAVNTVVRAESRTKGYNTDVPGMKYALDRAGIGLSGKRVLILGSGGTSHTAAYLAGKEGAASVDIVSRTGRLNYSNCYGLGTQVIINATPVGMSPDMYASPIDLDKFDGLEGVFDCIYNPLETLLVSEAKKRRIRAANGLDMLVEQARLAHNLFSEVTKESAADAASSERVASALISRRRNIVLAGMSGSGKSTIARALGEALDREVLDTDDEVRMEAGKDIPAIFEEEGERGFRLREKRAVKECCTRLGVIISTGGGAALDKENAFYMKCNGVVVLIERDAELLQTSGRPLTKDRAAARALYEARKPIYATVGDIFIKNDGGIKDAVNAIIKELERL